MNLVLRPLTPDTADDHPEDAMPQWVRELPLKDSAHLAAIHTLPCQVCEAFGLAQTSPTEAHHPIHGRFSGMKAPDGAAIALCMCHHQGLRFDRDKDKLAIHQGKETWEAEYGRDYTYTSTTRAALGLPVIVDF